MLDFTGVGTTRGRFSCPITVQMELRCYLLIPLTYTPPPSPVVTKLCPWRGRPEAWRYWCCSRVALGVGFLEPGTRSTDYPRIAGQPSVELSAAVQAPSFGGRGGNEKR